MGFFPTVNIDVFAVILSVVKFIYTFALASEIHMPRMPISTPDPYNYSLTFSLKKFCDF